MGTNYYTKYKEKSCPNCKGSGKDYVTDYPFNKDDCWTCYGTGYSFLHIGKSSAGWQFSFRAYEDLKLTSYQDWLEFLIDKEIYNEYGEIVELKDLLELIKNKQTEDNLNHCTYCRKDKYPYVIEHGYNDCFLDKEGYSFTLTEFS